MPAGEEIGRVEREEIPFRPEVVVDDVKQHRDPARVRRLDESLEVFRPSVACVRSVRKSSVIAPVPAALEVADRHDLDGRHPEVREMVQLASGPRERALRGKGAEMEFVKHDLIPFAAFPGLAPAVGARVDRLTRAVDIVRLKTRCGIGNASPTGQRKHVARARRQAVHEDFEESAPIRRHRDGIVAVDQQRDLIFLWGPETKAYPAFLERRAVRPFQHAVFHSRQPAPVRTPT